MVLLTKLYIIYIYIYIISYIYHTLLYTTLTFLSRNILPCTFFRQDDSLIIRKNRSTTFTADIVLFKKYEAV